MKNVKLHLGTFGLMSLEKAYLALPQINILEEYNQENTMRNLIKNNFAASFEKFQNYLFQKKRIIYVSQETFISRSFI